MKTTTKLVALYYDNDRTQEKYLATVQALLPVGCSVYHNHGTRGVPKLATVGAVATQSWRVCVWVVNPKTDKGKWIDLGSVLGKQEEGYDAANTKDIYQKARALKLA